MGSSTHVGGLAPPLPDDVWLNNHLCGFRMVVEEAVHQILSFSSPLVMVNLDLPLNW